MSMDQINGINSVGSNMTTPGNNLGQKDFLRLMIAQFKNQDPTSPKTNGDFLAQLAQFSTNDGIGKMQESIQQLANSLQSNQALQASSLVGRKVLVNSNTVKLAADGESKISVDLPAPVNKITASIYSETGELIRQIPLGQHGMGLFDFSWDGMNQQGERVPAGNYAIKVNGIFDGKEVALRTMTAANVDSVSLGQNGEGVKLNVAGIGSLTLDQVRQITA
ncbi:flagellar basal body rod modification protein [Legionella quinlivanii]|uniref:Basal-body rod modification protein FlgD n=1 Tax=Legionella quinlivanii TaxID=45073 RepID=A0A0W0XYW0_9GAMM|nr:flagellar hook assembly protein FlgD [Legionella quinlivanii]KTD49997.1 flagellar basal body rod modification protein [Legionella quinlivanii]MCW8450592.1 flagellar hook assembly protein FlgD [Legionella quinlivanii]SEF95221.1 flagellar basal-body rod modification protein FlgD [Legionella quinlivanii DSM 21216]STY11227.1 flagellar basal-body rod modification protein FlgD [Legionella quinlivanii]